MGITRAERLRRRPGSRHLRSRTAKRILAVRRRGHPHAGLEGTAGVGSTRVGSSCHLAAGVALTGARRRRAGAERGHGRLAGCWNSSAARRSHTCRPAGPPGGGERPDGRRRLGGDLDGTAARRLDGDPGSSSGCGSRHTERRQHRSLRITGGGRRRLRTCRRRDTRSGRDRRRRGRDGPGRPSVRNGRRRGWTRSCGRQRRRTDLVLGHRRLRARRYRGLRLRRDRHSRGRGRRRRLRGRHLGRARQGGSGWEQPERVDVALGL